MSKIPTIKPDTRFNLLVLLALSFLATIPVWINGIPNGEDLPHHFQFVSSYYEALQNGILYPSWASQLNYGYGDIGVRFYPPLSHYVLIFFKTIAGNWFDGSCLTFVFYFYLGAVGVYFWSREWFSEKASLFAAVFYIFIPYHLAQLYSAFLYAEFAASAILPFCFLFVTRICLKGKAADVLGLSVFYALLILTHLPTSIIGSIALGFYGIFSLKKENFLSGFAKLAASVLTGLAASSFYWVRMATELNFVAHNANPRFTSADYDFHSNFLFSEIINRILNQNNVKIRLIDTVFFITLGIIISCALVYFVNLKNKRDFKLTAVAAVIVLTIFISSPLSLPVWENLTVLQKIQFPWRWLTVFSMCGTIFTAAAFTGIFDFSPKNKRPLVFLTWGLIAVAFTFSFLRIINPLITYPRTEFNQIVERLKNSQSNDCWWTIWARGEAVRASNGIFAGDREIQIVSQNPTEKILRLSAGKTESARINIFYYPHWQAFSGDQKLKVEPAEDGAIRLALPPGETVIKVIFIEPLLIKAAFYL